MPTQNKTAHCPECHAKVTLKRVPKLGQTVVCKSCHMLLEVIETYPLELDWASDDALEEDYDDRDAYDYDDEDDPVYSDYYDD